ncbi:RagB/SusD family nutrient uptake outer membrane protein [Chitinophaga sp.]|uniref:RagB/SusD family nutrient uptake outer membrane protein n=1 Tax=Chitinophaga sp. TaxID=1869181 RepID=UPI0026172A3B|nr:RagB/SusD family nutrient uptake outer membrane protein [uncultured Chitinophaga sp.]
MRKLRFIIIILTAGMAMSSCNKFLDVKPKGKLIPSEVVDFDHLLDHTWTVQYIFLDNNGGSMVGYLNDNIELSEGMGKIAYKANNHPNVDRFYAYTFRKPYRNPNTSDYFWDWGTYRAVTYYNNIIDGITGLKAIGSEDQQFARSVLAQARSARGFQYFLHNMLYGPVYKPGTANNTRTIPYLTNSDINAPMVDLSTQEEVFKLAANDMHSALPDAPATTNWPSRANKTAVQAMLAYYHLFTRRYDSVAHYANLAWTGATAAGGPDKVLYNYNQFTWTNPANPVSSTIKAQDNFLEAVNSREILLYRSEDRGAGRSSSSYPSEEFTALFDAAADLRYTYFFLTAPGYKTTYNDVTYDDGQRVQYYRGSKTQLTSGFTYPEVLLMRAEAYARTGKLAEAIADLNLLRRYRFKPEAPQLTVGTQDEVIAEVLKERRRELPASGIKRFLDLKRFVLDAGKPWQKTKVVHKLGTETYEAAIDSDAFILNIANTILQYNPHWNVPLDNRTF